MPSLRVIGPGRAGRSLATAIERAGWDLAGLLGRDDDIDYAATGVDLLVIATPDRAVAEVAGAVEPVPTTAVAHLAGALGLDVLAPHPRRAAIHPLVALPDAVIGGRRLASGAWFAVAGDPIAAEVVAALGGHAFEIDDGDRQRYHAAAVIASNHLVALMAQVERVGSGFGAPLDAYLHLARTTLDSVAELGPAGALTGPAARGDTVTIERHLAALDAAERPLYQALAVEARRLAAR